MRRKSPSRLKNVLEHANDEAIRPSDVAAVTILAELLQDVVRFVTGLRQDNLLDARLIDEHTQNVWV